MASIKVASWNIQDFGPTKTTTSFINFVATVIDVSGVHIAGIMEIVSTNAPQILKRLLNELNTRVSGTSYTWQGILSDPTYHGKMEQYIYVWKESLTLQPVQGSFLLPGILSDGAFTGAIRTTHIQELHDLLLKHGYIDGGFWISVAKVNHMVNANAPLDFGTDVHNLLPQELVDARAILIQHRNMGLNFVDLRPPYLAAFDVGGHRLHMALLHAPNPSDPWRASVINCLANSEALTSNDNVLIMGDFNVKHRETLYGDVYTVNAEEDVVSGSTRREVVFELIRNAGFEEKLNKKTSLLDISSVSHRARTQNGFLVNHYDRFFLRNTPNSTITAQPADAEVMDVMGWMVQGGSLYGSAYYYRCSDDAIAFTKWDIRREVNALKRDIAKLTRTISTLSKSSKLDAKTRKKIKDKRDEIRDLTSEMGKLNLKRIDSMYGAFFSYRHVSDHMPIQIKLTY